MGQRQAVGPSIIVLRALPQLLAPSAVQLLICVSITGAKANPDLLVRHAETMGSACSLEGQWNCMTNSWQRCAASRWSAVVDCAAGTHCDPAGLTNDLAVEGTDGKSDGPDPDQALVVKQVALLDLLAVGLDDYTTTARGDEGSFEALRAARALWQRLRDGRTGELLWAQASVARLSHSVLRLAAEKLDRVRPEVQEAVNLVLQEW